MIYDILYSRYNQWLADCGGTPSTKAQIPGAFPETGHRPVPGQKPQILARQGILGLPQRNHWTNSD